MLEKLIIDGFQSHTHTVLEFDAKSNVVKGDNGSGKSAIRRALLWVLTNKPVGTAFINWEYMDNEPCSVTVHYNNHIVSRRRSRDGKINEYVVDGDVLTAFGVSVPQPVLDIFALDDTNIELQHSALFMLSESAPEMARRLNKLTNLEDIDKAYASIRKRKLEAGRKAKDEEERLKKVNEQLADYDWVAEAEDIANKLERIGATYSMLQDDVVDLKMLIEDMAEAEQAIKPHATVTVHDIEQGERKFSTLHQQYTDVRTLYTAYMGAVVQEKAPFSLSSIDCLRDEVVKQAAEVHSLRQLIYDVSQLVMKKQPPIYAKELNLDAIRRIMEEYLQVMKDIDALRKLHIDIQHTTALRDGLLAEFKDNMPEVCPLCGQYIHHEECV